MSNYLNDIMKVVDYNKTKPTRKLKKALKKICKEYNIDWFYINAYFWQPIKDGKFINLENNDRN